MAEVGSLLGTAENLTNLWRARICKISRQKCRICKFLRQNFVFVNFCNKNVTFSNTRYPKIPDYSENISGRVRVLLKIIGSDVGRCIINRFVKRRGDWRVSFDCPLHLAIVQRESCAMHIICVVDQWERVGDSTFNLNPP